MGDWLRVNGEAIYGTRPIAPYRQGQVVFTQKGRSVFAIYLTPKAGDGLPQEVALPTLRPKAGSQVHLLGVKAPVEWATAADGTTTIRIPAAVAQKPPCQYAFAFRFTR